LGEVPAGSSDPDAGVNYSSTRAAMSRTIINLVVDTVLLLVTMSLLFTSVVLRFVFPAPAVAAGWTLWGRGYDAWANLQFVLMAIISLAILLHLMLHWSWVCGVVLSKVIRDRARYEKVNDGSQTLWGVAMLIVVINVLGALVGLAYLTIQTPGG
jgi:hypothetical protein